MSPTTFDSWYEPTGTGSGDGSGADYTVGYRAFLEAFMVEHNVKSVLDVGCGDWQFSRLIDWGDREYAGTEVVQALVDRLRAEYRAPRRHFLCTDLRRRAAGDFDLAIVKDVSIHLPNADVSAIVRNLTRCRHVLLVDDFAPGPAQDIEIGHYRPLDMSAAPFHLRGEVAYRFPRIHNAHKVAFYYQPERT